MRLLFKSKILRKSKIPAGAKFFIGFLILGLFFFERTAHAYIDPGSGGYLLTSLLAWIGGAIAFSAAFLIHFFKFTFKNFTVNLWNKHRIVAVLLILVIFSGIGLGGYYLFKPSPKKQGGLVITPAHP